MRQELEKTGREGRSRAEACPAAGDCPGEAVCRATGECRYFDSRDLLGGGRVARIAHQGGEYQLRLTRAGKLILTK